MSKYVCVTPFKWRQPKTGLLFVGKIGDTFEAIPIGGDWLGPGWVKAIDDHIDATQGEPAPAPAKPKRRR